MQYTILGGGGNKKETGSALLKKICMDIERINLNDDLFFIMISLNDAYNKINMKLPSFLCLVIGFLLRTEYFRVMKRCVL